MIKCGSGDWFGPCIERQTQTLTSRQRFIYQMSELFYGLMS